MVEALRGLAGADCSKVRYFIISCMVRSEKSYGGPEDCPAVWQIRKFFEQQLANSDVFATAESASQVAAETELDAAGMTLSSPGWGDVFSGQMDEHADMLRDLVGNPFRQVVLDPNWITTAVTDLATHIDRTGSFDLMPALGAALSDAGCNDPQVLEHLPRDAAREWLLVDSGVVEHGGRAMTENEWLSCSDPAVLLAWLRAGGRLSDRKARLFAVACCRRVMLLLTDERSREALATVERAADGHASAEQIALAVAEATGAAVNLTAACAFDPLRQLVLAPAAKAVEVASRFGDAGRVAALTAKAAARAKTWAVFDQQKIAAGLGGKWVLQNFTPGSVDEADEHSAGVEAEQQCPLLRDLFRWQPREPVRYGAVVVAVAAAIYDGSKFDMMPALGAALSDAGCADAEMLRHCGLAGHVNGCWLVDLLLERD